MDRTDMVGSSALDCVQRVSLAMDNCNLPTEVSRFERERVLVLARPRGYNTNIQLINQTTTYLTTWKDRD